VLAKQNKLEEEFQKELDSNKETYSGLVPKLIQEVLRMELQEIEDFGEDEYQHLDTLIKKKIGIKHKIHRACFKFWNYLLIRPVDGFEKFVGKDDGGAVGIFFLFLLCGMPITFGATIGSLTGSVGIGIISGIAHLASAFTTVCHYSKSDKNPAMDNCNQCHYLEVSKVLKVHNIPKALPVEKVKQLV